MSQEQKSWEQMSWGTNVLGTYVFWDQMSLEDRSLRTKAREQKSGDQMSRGTNVKHPNCLALALLGFNIAEHCLGLLSIV